MAPRVERHARLYRLLTLLYPAEFRRQFGAELEQSFRDHLRHPLGATRLPVGSTWVQVAGDLARTVPRQRMESLMARLSPASRSFVIVALAAASLAAVALLMVRVPFVIVLVALLVAGAAIVRARQAADGGLPWYGVVGAGVTVFALLAAGDALVPDVTGGLADVLWNLSLASFLLGWMLILAGAAMGLATGLRRVRRNAA